MWGLLLPVLRSTRRIKKQGLLLISIISGLVVITGYMFAQGINRVSLFEAETGTLSNVCTSRVDDATAAGAAAVTFVCTPTANPDTPDPTGVLIAAIYPVPTTQAVFLSTNGNDANTGTEAQPVATLSRAISLVPSGGTIVVRGGVYRDSAVALSNNRLQPVSKRFTLQSYLSEQVWFDGTDRVTSWTSDGSGRWYTSWDTPTFCHHFQNFPAGGYYSQVWPWNGTPAGQGPCVHPDMVLAAGADADPQMIFADGSMLTQVRSLAVINTSSFYHDVTQKRLYIGLNPSGRTLEVTKRAMALALEGGSGGNIIRGVGFRRYATNQKHEGSYTAGVLMLNVPNVTLENTIFLDNAGGAVSYVNSTGMTLRRNVFLRNGYTAVLANGTSNTSTTTNGATIEENLFIDNNAGLYGEGCLASCGQAGMKLAHMNGFVLKNNLFEGQRGTAHGFWCDLQCKSGVMVNNVFRSNTGNGLYYEVSESGIIASNLSHDNGEYGIKLGSATTKLYNNTVVKNAQGGFLIYDDDRSPGIGGWTDISANTTGLEVANNVLVLNNTVANHLLRTSDTSPNTGPNTFFTYYDHNAYFRASASVPLTIWKDPMSTNSVFYSLPTLISSKSREQNSQDFTDNSNPLVNMQGGNYGIRPGALSSGAQIPADVASAIGISFGTSDKGALKYWPNGQ
jgi:hypothetical protein